jgi:AraC-like DNA-binding protein
MWFIFKTEVSPFTFTKEADTVRILLNFKRQFKKRSLLTTTIISYVSIVLVSLIILTSVIMTFFISEIKTQNIKVQNQVFSSIAMKSGELVNEMNKVSMMIYFNSNVSRTKSFSDPIGRSQIIQSISELTLNATALQDLVLYTNVSPYLYNRESTFTFDTLKSIYQFQQPNPVFLDYLKKADTLKVFPAETVIKQGMESRMIPIVFPDTNKDASQNRSILFLVKEENLLNVPSDAHYAFLLVDAHGNVVARSGAHEDIDKINLNGEKVSIKGNGYYLFKQKSGLPDLSYVMLVPNKIIDAPLVDLIIIVIISVVVVLLLSLAIIMLSIKYNYKPVRALKNLVEETLGKPFETQNEIDAITESLHEMASSIRGFVDFNTTHKSTFRDVLLSSAIQGFYSDINEVNSFHKYSNIYFRFDTFLVLSLFIQDYTKHDVHKVLNKIEGSFEGGDLYFKSSDNPQIYYAVLCIDSKTKKQEAVESVFNSIKNSNISVTMGVSSTTQDLSQLWCLYMEAVTALDYRLVKGLGSVIDFSEVNAGSVNWGEYPSAQIETFATYLEHGDIDKAIEMIDEIFKYTQKHSSSLFIARCLCFDIIITIMKRVQDITYKPTSSQGFNIMNFETVEDLIEEAKKFCINECQAVDNDNYLLQEAINYIKENYCASELYIKDVADKLGISQTALYNLFKENLAITPLQYINNLQIEKVKELLVSTDLPITTIVQKIGRLDTSNFIRKFKNHVGMTPGEYRKYYGYNIR